MITTPMPDFEGQKTLEGRIDEAIRGYYQLRRELEYGFGHIEPENFTSTFLKDFTELTGGYGTLTTTVEQLGVSLSDAEGDIAALTLTTDSIQSKVTSHDGSISTITQWKDLIQTKVSGHDTKLGTLESSISQNAKDILLRVKSTDFTGDSIISKINLSSTTATISASRINLSGYVTISSLGKDGSTAIDGSRITTGKISADRIESISVEATSIKGNSIGIKDDADNEAGYIAAYYRQGESYVQLCSESGRVALEGATVRLRTMDTLAEIELSGYYGITVKGDLSPVGNGDYSLGGADHKWMDVWADNGVIQTSDANRKHDIEPLPEKYLWMMDMIEPKRYRMNDGTSGRYHVGFIAQEVEAAMEAAWVDSTEFGGWVKDVGADGNDIYMLRYDEFIGIIWAKIRQLDARVRKMEEV